MLRLKNLLLTHSLNKYRNSSAPPMYTSEFPEAIYNFTSSATSKTFLRKKKSKAFLKKI